MSPTKVCTKCRAEKPLDQFHKRKRAKDGCYSHCKACHSLAVCAWSKANREKRNAYTAKYHAANREKIKARLTAWRAATKEARRAYKAANAERDLDYKYQSQFGISLADYNAMFAAQGERCGVCKTHQSELRVRLAVDHCHTTGKVRGLLCTNCNTAIGHLKDSQDNLTAAIAYLRSAS